MRASKKRTCSAVMGLTAAVWVGAVGAIADNPINVSGGASALADGVAVTVTSSGSVVEVLEGAIVGSTAAAVPAVRTGNSYTLLNSGTLSSTGTDTAGVIMGASASVNNAFQGIIFSLSGSGLEVGNTSSVTNEGVIDAGVDGIRAGNNSTIYNKGTGEIFADRTLLNGLESCGIQAGDGNNVTNEGLIASENASGISVGSNNNRYNAELGTTGITNNGFIVARENGIQAVNNNTIVNNFQIGGDGLFGAAFITQDRNGDGEPDRGDVPAVPVTNGIVVADGNTVTNNGGIFAGSAGILAGSGNTITNNGDIQSDLVVASNTGIHAVDRNTIINSGTIISQQSSGIVARTGNDVINDVSGYIQAAETGITVTGDDNDIVNNGIILAATGTGIAVDSEPVAAAAGLGNRIVNNGFIGESPFSVEGFGVGSVETGIYAAAITGPLTVTNNGTIHARGYGIETLGQGEVVVNNRSGVINTYAGAGVCVGCETGGVRMLAMVVDTDTTVGLGNRAAHSAALVNSATNHGLIDAYHEVDGDFFGGDGIRVGSYARITNSGAIESLNAGIVANDHNTVVNTGLINSDPVIGSGASGIEASKYNIIENSGSIISGLSGGISALGHNEISNSGIIDVNTDGITAYSRNIVTNTSSGMIVSASGTGIYAGQSNRVTNSGYISASTGIYGESGNTITNSVGGYIFASGTETGISVGSDNVVANDGTIIATDGTAIAVNGNGNRITNNGTVNASADVVHLHGDGNEITNNNVFIAAADGIDFCVGTGNKAVNKGIISTQYTGITDDSGTGNMVENYGVISAGLNSFRDWAAGVDIGFNGTVLNGNNATITSNSGPAIVAGEGSTVENFGTVSTLQIPGAPGDNGGVVLYGGVTLTALKNHGVIHSVNYSGVEALGGNVEITNAAGGTIMGTTAIHMSGDLGAISNSGTLRGTTGVAINTEAGSEQLVTLNTGSRVTGNVQDDTSGDGDEIVLAGAGQFDYGFSNYEYLTKQGEGAWVLTGSRNNGDINYGGNWFNEVNVNGGAIQVDGHLYADDVNVGGGTLAGSGTIHTFGGMAGSVHNRGIVSPGAAAGGIGTLTVDGDYYQDGGTLHVELSSVTGVDLLRVNNSAYFGSEAGEPGTVKAIPVNYLRPGNYTFLTSGNLQVSGVAPLAVTDSALLSVSTEYDDFDMWLKVAHRALSEIGGNSSDQTVFDVISGLAEGGNPNAQDAMASLLQQGSSAGALAGIGLLSPEQYASFLDVGMAGSQLYRTGLLSRLGNLHLTRGYKDMQVADNSNIVVNGSPALTRLPAFQRTDGGWSGWARALGMTGEQDSTKGNPGFEMDGYGLALGLDNKVGKNLVLGIGGGYTQSEVDFDGSQNTDVDGYHVSLYGSYSNQSYYLDAALLYAGNNFDSNRMTPGGTAASDTDGTEVSLYLGGGVNLAELDKTSWYLIPTFSAQWAKVDIDGFSEGGAGPFNLTVADFDANSILTNLGLRLGTTLTMGSAKVTPELRLSWSHEFGDTDRDVRASFTTLGGPSFTVSGVEPERDSALLGLGLNAQMSRSVTLYLDYDGEFRSDFDGHSLSGGLRWNF